VIEVVAIELVAYCLLHIACFIDSCLGCYLMTHDVLTGRGAGECGGAKVGGWASGC